ncbi:TPA: histone deacetylase [Vibrio parahaemolyticus]|uniref:histone deacetylase family protein n=1 Tax=Vibrio parahaemolyticus TaxID=670 RepID=UPI00038E18AB|nr:histone deacetylase [Vibrio parahaemolyticus]EGR1121112.1 histone deacetylase [Vibrio parahaemolyticus]EQM14475.1 histone deacetylase domain protein [Vibrio parahaemolyticus 3259]ETJ90482.1 histone deacetylase domain protein [Vibrio parahaemolyticus EKP-008]TOP81076.1 histone deacetylase [Vibrio parahaemolyticus]HCH2417423.1 histone deacetylase [Vibrio parahaemolyticus]
MLPLIYHPIYSKLELPEGHRYPIMKYQYLYEEVRRDVQAEWVQFFEPQALSIEAIKRVHDAEYVDLLAQGNMPAAKMRRIGFPWSEALITRTLTSAAGTLLTAEKALEHGIALHLSGGYHHAHKDFGSGFCLFNDLVIAAKHMLDNEHVDKILIIDSDVHHGDGTATLCQEEPDIVTLSFHCDKNFPARKPHSDLDVPLAKGTDDETFLMTFKEVVEMALNLHRPDMVIYDAGVDIHQDDELGYFDVSTQAIFERDRFLFQLMKNRGIPVAAVVGGGYRTNHADLVPIHMQLIKAAKEVFAS